MNFDQYIERRGTNCCKWDLLDKKYPDMNVENLVPMWIADTDFLCPPEVVDAVMERAQAGIYGYNIDQPQSYNRAVRQWMQKRYSWEVDEEWIVFTPGIVPALALAVQALTEPGDGVIIQPPVYYPFRNSVENNERVVRCNSLVPEGDTYRMDLVQLEEFAAEPRTKLMILCSPHNPVGRVWSREEIEAVCDICARHDVTIVSDEIHADLIMRGVKFTSTGPVAQEKKARCISCYAPSKTFNVAGLQASAILIPDPDVRALFRRQMTRNAMPGMNVFAGVALESAWSECDYYIEEVMAYVEANIDHAVEFAGKYMPKIRIRKPQGTFLGWVDLRGLGLDDEQANRFFLERAGIVANAGSGFGAEGAGFVRVNFACPRSVLDKALQQLRDAYEKEFN